MALCCIAVKDQAVFNKDQIQKQATHRNPLCLDHLVNGQPLVRIGLEASSDQILRLVGHLGPLWFGELVLTQPDPLLHSRGDWKPLEGVERWESTQPIGNFSPLAKIIDTR